MYTKRERKEESGLSVINEINTKAIGRRLTELRGSKTQKEVAGAVNISVSALSMYESGERIPRDNIKIRLSKYYNKPIVELFYTPEAHET